MYKNPLCFRQVNSVNLYQFLPAINSIENTWLPHEGSTTVPIVLENLGTEQHLRGCSLKASSTAPVTASFDRLRIFFVKNDNNKRKTKFNLFYQKL